MSTDTFSAENTFSAVEKGVSFLVSGISSQQLDSVHALIRKAAHVTEYFILGIFVFRALRGELTASRKWRWSFFALVVVVLWAAMDEFHQSFVLTRTASPMDVGLDTAGAGRSHSLWSPFGTVIGGNREKFILIPILSRPPTRNLPRTPFNGPFFVEGFVVIGNLKYSQRKEKIYG